MDKLPDDSEGARVVDRGSAKPFIFIAASLAASFAIGINLHNRSDCPPPVVTAAGGESPAGASTTTISLPEKACAP